MIGKPTGKEITVTVADVINAIEQNGYKQIKGEWVTAGRDGQLQGCAIGQGAINLGVSHVSLTGELWKVRQDKRADYARMSNLTMYLNDRRSKTIPEIVAVLREKFSKSMDQTLTLRTAEYTTVSKVTE